MNLDDIVSVEESRAILLDLLVNCLGRHRAEALRRGSIGGLVTGGSYDAPVPEDDLPSIGAPATRALASIGVTRLSQLVDYREADLLQLHGFGPRALRMLDEALRESGRSFRD